jgi:uncharacterized protein
MPVASALWRRLDGPGHDACRLEENEAGWRLSGMAVFRHEEGTAQLHYAATCDRAWRSEAGRVYGWLGAEPVDINIERTVDGSWKLNGDNVAGLARCIDLDFSFTPATNLFQIRRLALTHGQSADAPAAWFDVTSRTLAVLAQRYERLTDAMYRYEAPALNYAADLEITATGFVRRYGTLWALEE